MLPSSLRLSDFRSGAMRWFASTNSLGKFVKIETLGGDAGHLQNRYHRVDHRRWTTCVRIDLTGQRLLTQCASQHFMNEAGRAAPAIAPLGVRKRRNEAAIRQLILQFPKTFQIKQITTAPGTT